MENSTPTPQPAAETADTIASSSTVDLFAGHDEGSAVEALRWPALETIVGPWQSVVPETIRALFDDIRAVCGVDLGGGDTFVRSAPLSFYEHFDLYVIDVAATTQSDDGAARREYLLWGAGGLVALDTTSDPIHRVNAQLHAIGDLRLTTDTILDYVRFSLAMVKGPEDRIRLLEQADITYQDLENVEVVRWIEGMSLPSGMSPSFFVEPWIRYTDRLLRATLIVDPDGTIQWESLGQIGTMVPLPADPRPLAPLGLTVAAPDTVDQKLLAVTQQGIEKTRRTVNAVLLEPSLDAWSEVDLETQTHLVAAIRAACEVMIPLASTVVRKAVLGIYPFHDLYAVDVLLPAMDDEGAPTLRHHRGFVLWGTGGLVPLSRTNLPIYSLNDELEGLAALQVREDTVLDYIRMFFGLVEGQYSRFHLIENATVRSRTEEGADEEMHEIGPLRAERDPTAAFRTLAMIRFQDALFSAWVVVDAGGFVRLEDHKELGPLVSPPELAPAVTPLELTLTEQAERKHHQRLLELALDGLAGRADTWTKIDAKAFREQLRGGKPLHRLDVVGKVTVTDADLPASVGVAVTECRFRSRVAFEANVLGKELALTRCLFKNGLRVRGSWQGDLRLRVCDLTQTAAEPAQEGHEEREDSSPSVADASPSIELAEARFTGRMELDGIRAVQAIDLTRTKCDALTLNRILARAVVLGDAAVERSIEVHQAAAGGTVMASGVSCGRRFNASGCGEVVLTDAVVQGSVKISAESVQLEQTRITGTASVDLHGLGGSVSAVGLECGPLSVTAPRAQRSLELIDLTYVAVARLDLRELRTKGPLLLEHASVKGGVEMVNCTIGGKLGMHRLSAGNGVGLSEVDVIGTWDLSASRVQKRLNASAWFGSRSGAGVRIRGDLDLERAHMEHVILGACQVEGDLIARGARFASFSIKPWLAGNVTSKLEPRRSEIAGGIVLDGASISGDLVLVAVDVGARAHRSTVEAPRTALSGKRLKVHGDVLLTLRPAEMSSDALTGYSSFTGFGPEDNYQRVGVLARGLDWQPFAGSRFHGCVDLRGVEVGGELNLARARVEGEASFKYGRIGGEIVLRNTEVTGPVTISRCSVLQDVTVDACTLEGAADFTALSVKGTCVMSDTTVAGNLNLTDASLRRGFAARKLVVKGNLSLASATSLEDVDLRGLTLGAETDGGDLLAAGLVVEGTMRLADPDESGTMAAARIPGSLDLSRTRIRRLVLSHQCVAPRAPVAGSAAAGAVPAQEEISLEDARLGTLTVHEPPPSPLRLRGLEVHAWDFRPPADKAGPEKRLPWWKRDDEIPRDAASYIRFLAQSTEVHKPLYRSIEQRLYNEGFEKASDAVYRAMWRRDLTLQKQRLRKFLGESVGYFTTVPRVTWIILVGWFLASTLFFADPAVIEAKRSDDTPTRATAAMHPSPGEWGLADGLWVALRYHIPIVSLASREKWRPSDDLGTSFSPQDYGACVALLHWLIVPTLLLMVPRRMLRRARQNA